MKSSILAVLLLLNKTSGVKFERLRKPKDLAMLQYDDKITAAAMNDFKLYNMDKEDSRASAKAQSSFADAMHDKNANSLADEMNEEATEGSFNTATQAQKESAEHTETAFDQVNGVSLGMMSEGQTM